jgi:hypothetical protein
LVSVLLWSETVSIDQKSSTASFGVLSHDLGCDVSVAFSSSPCAFPRDALFLRHLLRKTILAVAIAVDLG